MARSRTRVTKMIRRQRIQARRGGWSILRTVRAFVVLTLKLFCLLIFLSAMGLLGFVIYRFAFLTDYFEMKTLVITGVSEEIASELRALSQLEANSGLNMLKLRSDEIQERLLKYPKIKSVTIKKRYPNALIIKARERVPAAVVAGGALYLIDREGYVLDTVANLNREQYGFPFITGINIDAMAFGEPIPAETIYPALDIFECLRDTSSNLTAKLSEVRVDAEEGLTLVFAGGVEVRLGREDFPERLAALELLAKQYGDLESLEYIDLRFDDQIVYRPRES